MRVKHKGIVESTPIETAVFDICDTLYYSNTTHDFVRFVMQPTPISIRKVIYTILNSKRLPLRYFLIFLSVKTGRDLLRAYNVRLLREKSKTELQNLARSFVADYLSEKKIRQIHDLVASYKNRGFRVVLSSSSIEPVVAAVAEALKISHYVSTTLEYDHGAFTGKISRDITNDKIRALKERDLLGELKFAASDNTSDVDLLIYADKAIAIVHNTEKEAFWLRHKIDTIKPAE